MRLCATDGFRPIVEVLSVGDYRDMHRITAYKRRETLNVDQLRRLKEQLVEEVGKYQIAIRGYSADRMAQHGEPYLAKLEAQVAEVNAQIAKRA